MEINIDINNIDDVVKFLNEGLSQGQKVTDIRKALGVGEKKLRKILKVSGYIYNQKLKQYIKVNDITTDVAIQEEC